MLKKPFNRLRQLFNTVWQFVPNLFFPQLSCPYSLLFTADAQEESRLYPLPSLVVIPLLWVTAASVTQNHYFRIPSIPFLPANSSHCLMSVGQSVQKTFAFFPTTLLFPSTAITIYMNTWSPEQDSCSLTETSLGFNPHLWHIEISSCFTTLLIAESRFQAHATAIHLIHVMLFEHYLSHSFLSLFFF